MKFLRKTSPHRPAALRPGRSDRLPRAHCSAWVLASLGLLLAAAAPVQAQGAGGTLAAGTLPVLRGVVAGSVIVNDPRATGATANLRGGPTLAISQQGQRAVLDWSSFNIAADSQVVFYHPSTTAATLNRIYGRDPSIVQGQLRSRLWDPATGSYKLEGSGGQLILINQNGILFDRGSQVNVGGLIASTLNLRNDWFTAGLALSASSAAFEGGYDNEGRWLARRPDGTRSGNIGIGSFGPASAAAPLIEATAGGSVMIFAPRIDNDAGVIKAPDGQVMLAAGKKVYLSVNPNASDITLRGLVVEVAAEDEGPGLNLSNLIRNAGELSADRGNVSLAALAVNQQGRVSANTAVQANGSIYLKARSRNADGSFKAGAVTLAAGSETVVDPDRNDLATVPESQAYAGFRGVIEVRGGNIASSGTLRATGGRLTLLAEDADTPSAARVYLDAGSLTSAAGAWSEVDPGKNLISLRVTSNELKNAPDQKTGLLRGATVAVDLRRDNNILDLSGYRGTVARTVAEKAAVGGELVINATGSVVQRAGATLDVSGGGYRYAESSVATSLLLGADGKVYDIASAPQALAYTAQLDRIEITDARWGQTRIFDNPLGRVAAVQPAYAQGQAAGTLSIGSSAGLVLDGTMRGGVTIGAQQLARAPTAGSLTLGIGMINGQFNRNPINITERIGNLRWQQSAADSLGAAFTRDTALATERQDNFALAATQAFGAATQTAQGRVETGFGSVTVNANGAITVPAGVDVHSDVGASLVLRSPRIEIDGSIRLPAGNLSVETVAAPGQLVPGPALASLERILVGSSAQLSTTGAWINTASRDGSHVGETLPTGRLRADGSVKSALDGGNIGLAIDDQSFQTRLARGATLQAGGGAAMNSSQRITGGTGGKISIANGNAGQTSSDWMQAGLSAFALGNGGELSLSLQRALIQANGANGTLPANTTRLEAGLFMDQGFSRVTVNALGSIDVAADTTVQVRQQNRVLDPTRAAALLTGSDLGSEIGSGVGSGVGSKHGSKQGSLSSVQTLPDHLRAPASISLRGGSLTVAETASITTDARGQIALSGDTALRIDGRLRAPGGSITLNVRGPLDMTASDLHLSETARLSTQGVFVPVPDARGLTGGTLFNGGNITLTAEKAGVRVAAGALVDVSGVSQVVDLARGGSAPGLRTQTLAGHAGTLAVHSEGATSLAGSLRGQGSGEGAAGGSFVLESLRPDRQATLPAERRIVVTAGMPVVAGVPNVLDARIDAAAMAAGGFDKLRLQSENRIEFQGASTLDFARGIRLDAPRIELADGASVRLQGANIALGQSLSARTAVPDNNLGRDAWLLGLQSVPVLATRAGTGLLTVQGHAVDFFGNLTLNGVGLARIESATDVRFIGRETFNASSEVLGQTGWLHTAGNIEFKAAQLYPSTRTRFDIALASQPDGLATAGSYLLVSGNGSTPGAVYSAAGSLTLRAETIVQNGNVLAPQGRLLLDASRLLELGSGSLTSVAGDGLTVLYGSTESGVTWSYRDVGLTGGPSAVDAVLAGGKRVDLQAPEIAVRNGAKLDLRGGGDVMAVEFVPGNGGDRNVTLQDNTYAIIPTAQLGAMPYDADLLFGAQTRDPGFGFSVTAGRDSVLYDAIDIGSGSLVPAGRYALLPARFALLPDAYLVLLQTGSAYRNLQDGQTTALLNGNTVVAGHRTAMGTEMRESHSVGVTVLPGAAVLKSSDFTVSGAALLAQAAERARGATPAAPWDAGRMSLTGASSLSLQGQFLTDTAVSRSATPARAAQVDIAGRRIALVDAAGQRGLPADFLQLEAASLSRLNASVLLGGTRTETAEGTRINTAASEVRVLNSQASAVTLPELTLVASQRIDIAAGSALRATGNGAAATTGTLAVDAASALVRLSSGAQASLSRGTAAVGAAVGEVNIGDAALLSASRSLRVDAAGSTRSTGQLLAGAAGGQGGSLALSSSQIRLGQTDAVGAPTGGLVLGNSDLARYAQLDELLLRGYASIDLIGSTQLGGAGTARLGLDTPLLRGVAVGDAPASSTFAAAELSLRNSGSTAASHSAGTGRLSLQADTLVLGEGPKVLAGFATVDLQAQGLLRAEGSGTLSTGAALALKTPLLMAGAGAQQRIEALEGAAVSITRGSAKASSVTAAALGTPELGGQIAIKGRRIEVATTLLAAAGHIELKATGNAADDGVVLAQGATLDAAGRTKSFNGSIVAADAGSVSLSAERGALDIQSGARVNVSAATATVDGSGPLLGDAGRLKLRGSTLMLAGELSGQSAGSYRSGAVDIDLGTLADFSSLNSQLNQGGFQHERLLRLRGGDLRVAAADSVQARTVALTADGGRIDVAGSIGRITTEGGAQITLNAASGLSLADGATLLAAGSEVGARGGEVRLATRSGALQFATGARIDVRAGKAGPAGGVVFAVGRNAAGQIDPLQLQGLVQRGAATASSSGLASVDVEATRVYGAAEVGSSISATQIGRWAADQQAFVTAAAPGAAALTAGLRDESGALAGARLLGALELQAAGSLGIDGNWDLTTAQWLAGGNPGTLSIRAAGNLVLRDTLGAPRLATSTNAATNDANQNINHAIRAGDTWNIRLAAGADLASADSLATSVQPLATTAPGDLLLSGANANIRTGTGRIDLAAARHFGMDNVASSIYTGGRIGATDLETSGNNRWAVDGGSISIRAGGNISGPRNARDLWITEWLRRPRLTPTTSGQAIYGFDTRQPTDWWAYRPRFQQAVGTLAGGDINIRAGGDVLEFSAMLPTAGRTFGSIAGGDRQVEVSGGGKLELQTGGDLIGGVVLVGRGSARVQAAGNIGSGQATQLFLMGASSGVVAEQASASLQAGGSVALRSVDNPTVLAMIGSSGAVGPSFDPRLATTANNNTPSSFYTYAASSAVGAVALGGNIGYEGRLVNATEGGTSANWRTFAGAAATNTVIVPVNSPAVFPASVALVAMAGDVIGSNNTVVTYPSASATVSLLADGALVNPGFNVSAREPATVVTPTSNFASARTANTNNLFNLLNLNGNAAMVKRDSALPFGIDLRGAEVPGYRFDLQALNGSISGSSIASLALPALSRVRAGTDLVIGFGIDLQNLADGDVSELRADSGDLRRDPAAARANIAIGGPGRLLLQAGRNIDLGTTQLTAVGNAFNPRLPSGTRSARLSLVAGVNGEVDLTAMDTPTGAAAGAYDELVALNRVSGAALNLFETLGQESDTAKMLAAPNIAALARDNAAYQPFVALDLQPRLLASYQAALRAAQVPVAAGADQSAALALYRLLNAEADINKLKAAGSLAALAALPGGGALGAFSALDERYPRLFADYVQRRGEGALPRSLMPIVFSDALQPVLARVVPKATVTGGSILTYQTFVQTQGGSDIDLWAPGGDIVVGLTTPGTNTIGVLTTNGGAVRGVLSGDFNVNQGKVITAQGGDILLFSSGGSIDAGRGAKTSATAPAPTVTRAADGTTTVSFSGAATGSGIQSLSSDPDGLGPRAAPAAGNVYLFAPAGSIDAGEAGIRSGGNILINAQAVRNATDIRAGGSSQGVPQLQLGSLASALASSGNAGNPAKAAEDGARAATEAAKKAAAAPPARKPTILTVEVMGFGDKNCKEDDKECFAK